MQDIGLPDIAWISLIVLIIISAIYIIQNHIVVSEMVQARKASAEPSLKPILQNIGPVAGKLVLKNVGIGPAFDIDIKIIPRPIEQERHFKERVLAPGDFVSFIPPQNIMNLKNLAEKFDSILFEGTYKNLYGDLKTIKEEIKPKEIYESWTNSKVMVENTMEDFVKKIGKELEAIKGQASWIKNSLDKLNNTLQDLVQDDDDKDES